MKIRTIILLFLLFITTGLQFELNNHQSFIKASILYQNGKFQHAMQIFQDLLKKEPNNTLLNYHVALCYLRLSGMQDRARQFFEKAAFKKTSTIPPVQEVLFIAGKIFGYPAVKFPLVDSLYTSSDTANLALNPDMNEKDIAVSGNGKVIAYEEKKSGTYQIYITYFEKNRWKKPINITSQLQLQDETYISSLSYDGQRLYLTKYDNFESDIYFSSGKGYQWNLVEKMNSNINTLSWDSHAVESEDGRILFFSSNRPGGQGGMDIYFSMKDAKGVWGHAENMGANVNTKLSEDYPNPINNGRALFFSTQAYQSKGGYDIYNVCQVYSMTYTAPQNISYPLNSDEDDFIYYPLNLESKIVLNLTTCGTQVLTDSTDISQKSGGAIFVSGIIDMSGLSSDNKKDVHITFVNNFTSDSIDIKPDYIDGGFMHKFESGSYLVKYKIASQCWLTQCVIVPPGIVSSAVYKLGKIPFR